MVQSFSSYTCSLCYYKQKIFYRISKICTDTFQEPPVIKNYFPGGWHHYDKEGRPVFLLRLGQMDAKGIIRSIGEEGLTKLVLHICEEGLKLTEESAHRLQQPISTWTMLLDLGKMINNPRNPPAKKISSDLEDE